MRYCLCRVLLLCLYLVCLACMSSDMNVPAVRRHARIACALFAFSYLPLSLDMEIGLYDRLLATSAVSSELEICSWTDLGTLCTYLAPDFPTPPRPPTDCIGIRSGHDEWTDDHHYRCSFAFCVLVGVSRFRRCCYLKEPSPNYRLPVFSALVDASNGCCNLFALGNSNKFTYLAAQQLFLPIAWLKNGTRCTSRILPFLTIGKRHCHGCLE